MRTGKTFKIVLIAVIISTLLLIFFTAVDDHRRAQNLLVRWSRTDYGEVCVLSRDLLSIHNSTDDCAVHSCLPTAYVITPTHARLTQEADLLRLCYTLMHVPHVRWIIVEDSDYKTELVLQLSQRCHGPNITHLTSRTPKPELRSDTNELLPFHRGVAQRNTGLAWLRKCVLPTSRAGGVYFADDDNTYDLKVFDVVRETRTVSMWKVGLAGGLIEEGPTCENGTVRGWRSVWGRDRRFPMDMAGFSIGLPLLAQFPTAQFSREAEPGHLESAFLSLFNVSASGITPAPDDNCSKVLAWHTQTIVPDISGEQELAQRNAEELSKQKTKRR